METEKHPGFDNLTAYVWAEEEDCQLVLSIYSASWEEEKGSGFFC